MNAAAVLLGTHKLDLERDHRDPQGGPGARHRRSTVLHLSKWASEHESISSSMRLTSKVNYWLSSKRLGVWDDVVGEVENFDCSALKPAYVLARASLLDDADMFFQNPVHANINIKRDSAFNIILALQPLAVSL